MWIYNCNTAGGLIHTHIVFFWNTKPQQVQMNMSTPKNQSHVPVSVCRLLDIDLSSWRLHLSHTGVNKRLFWPVTPHYTCSQPQEEYFNKPKGHTCSCYSFLTAPTASVLHISCRKTHFLFLCPNLFLQIWLHTDVFLYSHYAVFISHSLMFFHIHT